MKLDLFNNETEKVWKSISGNAPNDLLQLEIELYKKLLVYFQIGESCYFIFNFHTLCFDYVSEDVEPLLGYNPQEVTSSFLLENIHVEDRGWFLACQDHATQFSITLPMEKKMKYKVQYDFRLKRKDGIYVKLMLQSVVFHIDETGGIIRTLVVLTDISHIKKCGKPSISYIGMDKEPSFLEVSINHPCLNEKYLQDDRESRTKDTWGKYSSSSLSLSKMEEYLNRIQTGFLDEKWYLEADLSLKVLSKKSDIPPHYISQIINQHFGKNFSNYVNSYRIEALKQKLVDPSQKHITIEGLAYMSGFNSKASFQRMFKKHTGMSPKEYRSRLK